MSEWEAIILGIIQGLTEFLPVSSSGHLELGKHLFGLADVDLTFSVLVHGATACSTLVVFRNDILHLLTGLLRPKSANSTDSRKYVGWIILSAIPAALIAFTLRDALEGAFINQPHRVGMMLCLTALILFLSERASGKIRPLNGSKAGIIGYTKAVAKELGAFGVNVNAVAPGLIETAMLKNSEARDKIIDLAMGEMALKRIGQPEDLASVIAFLASDKARHITGDVIKVDGGQYI